MSPAMASQRLRHVAWWSLAVGLAAAAVAAALAVRMPERFFRAYLFAYLFWLSIPLGSLALGMLHALVGGGWGVALRRFTEAAMRTLPLMALLFVPLVAGLRPLYIWARPELVATDPLLQHRQAYMNPTFWGVRAGIYFAVWIVLAQCISRWSLQQDQTPAAGVRRRLGRLAAPGLVLYGVLMSLAGVDWIMSRDPHWYSTIFGFIVVVGQVLTALAFLILFLAVTGGKPETETPPAASIFNDLGNLLLTLVILWAYLMFAQFLIIWMGNTQQDITWYTQRGLAGGDFSNPWRWIGLGLVVGHFFVPFALLLFRAFKHRLKWLGALAAGVLLVHLLDQFWLVAPSDAASALEVHLADGIAPLAIGGLWMAAFCWHLHGRIETKAIPEESQTRPERGVAHA